MRLAAIDIGSNAVRLLLVHVMESEGTPIFIKEALHRVPLRLGEDVFSHGRIGEDKANHLFDTMIAFQHLMKVHQTEAYLAYATSAMRDAENAQELIKKIKEITEIKIKVITGKEEADVLFSNHIEQLQPHPEYHYLFIDIGGGSTELVLVANGQMKDRQSIDIGTLRIRGSKDSAEKFNELDKKIKKIKNQYSPLILVGSGGNINTLQKYFHKSKKQDMPCSLIEDTYFNLKDLSVEERILKYSLKPDRAEVIVPALQIILRITNALAAQKIIVPKIGLSDGMIRILYKNLRSDIPSRTKS
ncbi:MAG: exopolyphosphatase [Chitinophagales bacterium]|nr:exopolyphosphatase [Chitinophagales bacterium]